MPESYYWFNPPTVFSLLLILTGAMRASHSADPSLAGMLWWRKHCWGKCSQCGADSMFALCVDLHTTHNTLILSRNRVNGSYLVLSWCWLTSQQVWSWKIWRKRGSESWNCHFSCLSTTEPDIHFKWFDRRCSFTSVFVDFDCYSTTTEALPVWITAASALWSQEGSAIKTWWWGRLYPLISS